MTGESCPSCGGQWVDGRIAVPIVGSLRFVYRLGTNEVATEVAAQMCGDCGAVQLRARDPEAIVRAQRAAAQGRTKPWPIRSPKGPRESTQES
jgi:Zn-finger nucleic acid-binding protein